MNGLSCEFIIHPGETLKEVLKDRGMTQLELARRSGVTAKHISTVLNGEKPISVTFAKKLEYSLGIDAEFWNTLQLNYDKEMIEFEELHSISAEEKKIASDNLHDAVLYMNETNKNFSPSNIEQLVINLRKFLNISNLTAIPSLVSCGSFRAQTSKKIDPYLLFAWQQLCEHSASKIDTLTLSKEEQKSKLLDAIPKIKNIMFLDQDQIITELQTLFANCGIAFIIMPYFKGVPVQGFIKTNNEERTIISMTFRQKKADIFWFSLFHEIGHFINGDTKQIFIDFESVEKPKEAKADIFAENNLINREQYNSFIENGNFSLDAISHFAKEQNIPNFIIIGRLQKDKYIPWSKYQDQIIKFQ